MFIVFIGPPGAGKGTQCRRLSQHLGLPHISSGEMLRACKDDSDVGRMIAGLIDQGKFAPDELVMRFMIERLAQADCQRGCLLDGFPRTLIQAELFDQHLADQDDSVDVVVQLSADPQDLVARLLKRAETENRVDDTAETIQARLQVYADRTAPVLDHYRRQGIVHQVSAMQSPEGVFEQIRLRFDR